jgi:hypothetical protein
MTITPVRRDQFEFKNDVEIVHVPTGARISTYRYHNPENACSTVKVNWGKAGDRLESGEDYSREEVMQVACALLREQAKKVTQRT